MGKRGLLCIQSRTPVYGMEVGSYRGRHQCFPLTSAHTGIYAPITLLTHNQSINQLLFKRKFPKPGALPLALLYITEGLSNKSKFNNNKNRESNHLLHHWEPDVLYKWLVLSSGSITAKVQGKYSLSSISLSSLSHFCQKHHKQVKLEVCLWADSLTCQMCAHSAPCAQCCAELWRREIDYVDSHLPLSLKHSWWGKTRRYHTLVRQTPLRPTIKPPHGTCGM